MQFFIDVTDWSKSGDRLLGNMATNMLTKFDKYWGSLANINKLLVIGVLLDPIYKLDYVSYLFEATCDNLQVQEHTKVVKDTLIRLYKFYAFNSNEGTSNN